MNDSTFNAHEYFQKIYERPVILEAKQLSQVFKHGQTERTVLNKLDLKIHKREFICVIGPSGCGKSTLSRVIAGLDPYPVSYTHLRA
ncbi:ATP-binding cassette domain-containing protein, partial [Acinetobacter baumannii]